MAIEAQVLPGLWERTESLVKERMVQTEKKAVTKEEEARTEALKVFWDGVEKVWYSVIWKSAKYSNTANKRRGVESGNPRRGVRNPRPTIPTGGSLFQKANGAPAQEGKPFAP